MDPSPASVDAHRQLVDAQRQFDEIVASIPDAATRVKLDTLSAASFCAEHVRDHVATGRIKMTNCSHWKEGARALLVAALKDKGFRIGPRSSTEVGDSVCGDHGPHTFYIGH